MSDYVIHLDGHGGFRAHKRAVPGFELNNSSSDDTSNRDLWIGRKSDDELLWVAKTLYGVIREGDPLSMHIVSLQILGRCLEEIEERNLTEELSD